MMTPTLLPMTVAGVVVLTGSIEEALGIPLAGLTAPALLLLAVWLILTGRIVPRKTYDDALKREADWREAHEVSETARAEMAKQIEELLEHARTTDALIRALPAVRADP